MYCRKVSLIVKKCSEFALIEAKFDRVVFKFYSVNSQLVIPPYNRNCVVFIQLRVVESVYLPDQRVITTV